MIGTTLSHFKITAKLGEGGMGEVYRAEDTKLGREVAIKVLPKPVAQDPERLARFEREAKVLAALNHPHIAGIHQVEEANGVHFLVMELVEGEDLKERLARGPMAIEDVLPTALQIAEALEVAHERGIIHRDLKPANVKVTSGGQVKVLDFGLAKALEPGAEQATAGGDPSLSPTLTAQMTQAGMLLGTAAYMSPEQAAGEAADRRADIWAFGVVLAEMLSGRQLFAGKTASHVLAAVLKEEPDWERFPTTVPPPILDLLRHCLRKEPTQRIQAIGDARIVIQDYLEDPAAFDKAEELPATVNPPVWRRVLPWTLFALTAAALLMVVSLGGAGSTGSDAMVKAVIPPPEGGVFQLNPFHPGPVAISPDGTRVAVAVLEEDGSSRLWVRELDSTEPRALSGTEGAGYPFWSPDSRWIAYFSQIDGTLKKIDASGGPPITICAAGNGKGGSWNGDGVILFAPESDTGLYRVPAGGGAPVVVTEIDLQRFNSHRHPRFLPDGHHFLFLARGNPAENSTLMVGDLEDRGKRELLRTASQAEYASGRLLFSRESALMAQPLSLESFELGGEARPIVENLLELEGAALAAFSASESGVLTYQTGSMNQSLRLEWRDREGRESSSLGDPADYEMIALSPDGATAAVVVYDAAGTADLHLFEIDSGLHSRFTFDPGNELWPVWSPDASSLIFSSKAGGNFDDIYRKTLGGLGETELVYKSEVDKRPTSLSPDERWLLFDQYSSATKNDIFALPLADDREPKIFLQTEFDEQRAVFSPNGKWVAYSARESGRHEVFVAPFPGPGRKWQISAEGGTYPHWRADGQELIYSQADGQLLAVEVRSDTDSFRVGEVRPLFRIGPPRPYGPSFSITPDGQQLLISQIFGRQADTVLHVVVNWLAELESP